jgi:hypothetical protein
MRKTADIEQDISFLQSKLQNRDAQYLVNLNWFLSNGRRNEPIRENYTTPPGYYNSVYGASGSTGTGVLPAINVGRSIVLTLQSKLIQTKGRIFFDGVNGLWATTKLVRNAQIYFDAFADTDDIHPKVSKCLLDALMFGVGVMLTDGIERTNTRIKPWEFYLDPAEYNFGRVSRCMTRQEQYPLNVFADKLTMDKTPQAYRSLQSNYMAKIIYVRYWDLHAHKLYIYVGAELLETVEVEHDCMPFALIYYNAPVKGFYSTSVLDNTFANQKQIDDILVRIHDALALSPANTVYVPYEGSDPSSAANADRIAKVISNRVGNTMVVRSNGTPVVSTPQPIDAGYVSHLNFFIDKTYEQEGVSQLSASSKKPAGLNSGKALDTVQDVESERFQANVDALVQFYKDIYRNMIEVFPGDEDILPKRLNRAKIKWGEIKRQKESFTLQSSLASMLSNDPAKKMEEITMLKDQGIISPDVVASLMQIPDLDRAYNTATASYDYCMEIITRAIDDDEYDFYDVVNLNQLLSVVVNVICQLASEGEDDKIVGRLVKLLDIVTGKLDGVSNIQNPPPAGPPPMPPVDVQDTALNGAQIDGISRVLQGVATGQIPPASARSLILIALPNSPVDMIDAMLAPFITPPAPTADPAAPIPPQGLPPPAPI